MLALVSDSTCIPEWHCHRRLYLAGKWFMSVTKLGESVQGYSCMTPCKTMCVKSLAYLHVDEKITDVVYHDIRGWEVTALVLIFTSSDRFTTRNSTVISMQVTAGNRYGIHDLSQFHSRSEVDVERSRSCAHRWNCEHTAAGSMWRLTISLAWWSLHRRYVQS